MFDPKSKVLRDGLRGLATDSSCQITDEALIGLLDYIDELESQRDGLQTHLREQVDALNVIRVNLMVSMEERAIKIRELESDLTASRELVTASIKAYSELRERERRR